MNKTDKLSLKIGIIGGGQLGKMMILEAKKMGYYVAILDPTEKCPAHSIADFHIVADFDNQEKIRELSEMSDVITYEFEHIDFKALKLLEEKGKKVYPTPTSLEVIQNKYTQKQLLKQRNIPVPDFCKVSSTDEIKEYGEKEGYPLILKTCTGGYDGKGNAVIKNKNEVENAFHILGNGKIILMVEKFLDFEKEISVLACRGIDGVTAIYPVGENIHRDSILHETIVPAFIDDQTMKQAMELANAVMNIFDGIGMFCVEMFVTKDGGVLINEVAPRPHNSGHYTIEGCVTSQFEQHIRAITGLPLGRTTLLRPTVMINLLGAEGFQGDATVTGAEEALQLDGVKLHVYGKQKTAPKRKMGHITVTAETVSEARRLAKEAYEKIKIISEV